MHDKKSKKLNFIQKKFDVSRFDSSLRNKSNGSFRSRKSIKLFETLPLDVKPKDNRYSEKKHFNHRMTSPKTLTNRNLEALKAPFIRDTSPERRDAQAMN